ncbi:hypothetical protein AAFG07_33030 [Bradyrhizobium sp. B097]|uniref:hypothetical protein n=1 Tax=Bradyrhizobium sp. B097 TaxID=3140244 RepID=UPI003183B97E
MSENIVLEEHCWQALCQADVSAQERASEVTAEIGRRPHSSARGGNTRILNPLPVRQFAPGQPGSRVLFLKHRSDASGPLSRVSIVHRFQFYRLRPNTCLNSDRVLRNYLAWRCTCALS